MNKILSLLVLLVVALASVLWVRTERTKELEHENYNLRCLLDTMSSVSIDSVRAVSASVPVAHDNAEMENLLSDSRKTVEKLKLRIKDLELSQKTNMRSDYRIEMKIDTVVRDIHDTICQKAWRYRDRWIDVTIDDSTLHVSTRDSLETFVSKTYKHRFLWWRWGCSGYKVNIVNHNPHSTITYNNTIIRK